MDGSGNLFIPDTGNNRIEESSSAGAFITSFGSLGSAKGQFNHPSEVTLSGSGNLFVADAGNNRVEEFSSTGAFLMSFGSYGTGNGQLVYPVGFAVDGSGNVFVADSLNNRIEVFAQTVPESASLVLMGMGATIAAWAGARSARARRRA